MNAGVYCVMKALIETIIFGVNFELNKQPETFQTSVKGDSTNFEYHWKNFKSVSRTIMYLCLENILKIDPNMAPQSNNKF